MGKRKFYPNYLGVMIKGMAMGAADVIPGVSGGTIAFISGIYEELLGSIKSINLENLKLIFQKGGIVKFWNAINANFLLAVLTGILISVFSLASLLQHLLKVYPIMVWSFFFGLILSSSWIVAKKVKVKTWGVLVAFVVGVIGAFYITVATPTTTPDAYWFIFLSGAIAICAMILPGISGSFILLLLGKYFFILGAVTSLNIPILCIFAAGALIGIISFSNLLTWLLGKYHDITVGVLAGFMIGSLNKLWPWKLTLDSFVDRHGEVVPLVEKNVLPAVFEGATNTPAMLGSAIGFMLLGVCIITVIEIIANKLTRLN